MQKQPLSGQLAKRNKNINNYTQIQKYIDKIYQEHIIQHIHTSFHQCFSSIFVQVKWLSHIKIAL